MGFGKKDIAKNIGRFVNTGDEIVYVDDYERVWTQQNIHDLVAVFKHFARVQTFVEHYKKFLEK